MVYIRGQPEDYNEWNMKGWEWDEMLRRFKLCEKQRNMVRRIQLVLYDNLFIILN